MEWLNSSDVKNHIENEWRNKYATEPERRSFWAEVMRAKWVLYTERSNRDHMAVLKQYNVLANVITHLLGEEPTIAPPKERRSDKYEKLIEWCKANHLYQTNPNEVAEIGEISYPTALKFIKDRPDLFYRIKKGVYEVRNPDIVRAEQKS